MLTESKVFPCLLKSCEDLILAIINLHSLVTFSKQPNYEKCKTCGGDLDY